MTTPTAQEHDLSASKALVRRLVDGFNRNDPGIVDEVVAEDCVLHGAPPGPARETWKASITGLHDAFPDIHTTIEEVVAEGDLVVARERTTGTQLGDLFGYPASGKQAVVPTLMMLRIADGQIAERWVIADNLAMLSQLGHFPA